MKCYIRLKAESKGYNVVPESVQLDRDTGILEFTRIRISGELEYFTVPLEQVVSIVKIDENAIQPENQ